MKRVFAAVVFSAALIGCEVKGGGLAHEPSPVAPASTPTSPDAAPRDVSVRPAADVGGSVVVTSDAAPQTTSIAPDAPAAIPPPPSAVVDAAPSSTNTMPPSPPPPVPPVDARPVDEEAAGGCPRANAQLSLCLRFEGAVADESQHALRVSASNVRYEGGPSGMAASVGSSSSMRIEDTPLFDSRTITVEAWLSPRTLPAPNTRQGIVDSPGQYGVFLLPPASVACLGGATVIAPNALKVGTWISIACVFDADAVSVWVDGRRVNQAPSAPPGQGGGGGLSVGLNSPSGENFDGLLDNVRLWRATRTPAQLCASARSCN